MASNDFFGDLKQSFITGLNKSIDREFSDLKPQSDNSNYSVSPEGAIPNGQTLGFDFGGSSAVKYGAILVAIAVGLKLAKVI